MSKINKGNFFEDFYIGQKIIHPLPRTITNGDVTLYIAFTGSRFAIHSSDLMAQEMGYEKRPIDDILMFHLTFGKSVQDISLNAIANLGYAEMIFPNAAYIGDTIYMASKVIGLKENSNGKSGVVYVHSIATNQNGLVVIEFKRWVMVHKKDYSKLNKINDIPSFSTTANLSKINVPIIQNINTNSTGGIYFFEDYEINERLNHPEGMTIDNSAHTLATKLYQNNAKLHFDDFMMKNTKMKQRLIYGGIIISTARTISFNGLQNAQWVCSINSGTHCNPTYGGDTIYAYTEILDKIEINRNDIGILRVKTIAIKNQISEEVLSPKDENNKYLPNVVLDLDYNIVIPKKITQIK